MNDNSNKIGYNTTMEDFSKLLQATSSNTVKTSDFRYYKSILFKKAAKALSGFTPIDFNSTSSNPIQIIDFFSGAGGTSLGFAAINRIIPVFQFIAGCDINPVSAVTYSRNFGTPTVCEDILNIAKTPTKVRAFLDRFDFNKTKTTILIGCTPCQGFSSHRKKFWSEEDDDRNNLVIAFSQIVTEVNPDVFIMENVPEFLSKRYCQYFSKALKAFKKAGYIVKQNIYNAAAFGVPQKRFRTIIVGMKKEFFLPDGYFTPKEYKTVREAIGKLRPLKAGGCDPTDTLHKAIAHKNSTIEIIKKVPHDGGNLPEGEGPKCLTKVNGFYDVYGRLSWDKPAITITHYARNPASGRYTHPVQNRGLTAREAARLQSFPDGFQFEGKSDDIYRQIGEAVPPLLSCGVAVDILIEYLSIEPTTNQLEKKNSVIELPISNSHSNVIAGIKKKRKRA